MTLASQVKVRRSPAGLVAPSSAVLVVRGPAYLRAVTVRYGGSGTVFVQIHDAGALAAVSNETLLEGGGAKLSAATQPVYMEWPNPLRCDRGVVVALSASELAYVSTTEIAVITAQWSLE